MNIIALSQVYWPDTASTAQHLTDLLEALSKEKDINVTVLTSRRKYEDPKIKYSRVQSHNNVHIRRLRNTGFGKSTKLFRLIDFLSFNLLVAFWLIFHSTKRWDIMIGMTSPPLLSYIGSKIARFKKTKFVYWTMDLQPELSIIAKYLNKGSLNAWFLQSLGDSIFRHSSKIITLDVYMQKHIINRVGSNHNKKIESIPVWPVMNDVYEGDRLANPFRQENNFGDKFVIMYSGNHSVMHPLDTLLETARILSEDERFLFVHVGGGVRLADVKEFKLKYNLNNIVILPYQPREYIHISLGAADMQVVAMGDDCVGATHPNKIYGAMFIGKPILYIGPDKSHAGDILKNCEGNIQVEHGEHYKLSNYLKEFINLPSHKKVSIGKNNMAYANENFHPAVLINRLVESVKQLKVE